MRPTVRFLCLLAFSACPSTWSAHGDDLPNMVFLMTDDQGWGDVGYNGHPKIKAPHLDDMAKTGLRLDRDYDGINLLPLIDGKMKERKGIGFHCRGHSLDLAWIYPEKSSFRIYQ